MLTIPPIGGYRVSDLPRLLGLALLFAMLVRAMLYTFAGQDELVSLIWAPSGLAFAALLRWGVRLWPGIFLGALLVNGMLGGGVGVSLAYSGVNTLEAVVATWLFTRQGRFDVRLEHASDYLALMMAGAASALVSAALGVTVMHWAGFVDAAMVGVKWINWWQGDALGMAVVTPLLLIWSQPTTGPARWQRRLEALLLLGLVLVIGHAIFQDSHVLRLEETPHLYLMFVLMAWAALRFGRHGATALVMVASVQAALAANAGSAAFGPPGSLIACYNLWLFLMVLALVGTSLALTLRQRRRAETEARQMTAQLQDSLAQAQRAGEALAETISAQQRAEQTLAEQHAFLETILENEPECVKLLDASGRLLQMNRAGLAMLEVDSLAEAQAIRLVDFVHADHRAAFIALHRKVCGGETAQLEFRILGRRGSTRWLETHAVPFRVHPDEPLSLLGVTRDITARKLAELREDMQARVMLQIATGEPLPDILETIVRGVEQMQPGALCSILLLDGDGRSLRSGAAPSLPEFYNHAIDGAPIGPAAGSCGTAMYRGERVIVTDIASDPLWADYRALAEQAGLAACWSEPILGAGQRVLGSFAIYHRFPCQPDPADLALITGIAQLAGIAIERREAEQDLRRSEQRFQRVVDNISDALLVDDVDGGIVFANDRFLRMFGLTRRQLAQLDFLDLVAPEYREEIRERHQRRMRGEDVAEEIEFEGLRSDGTRCWLEARVSKVLVNGAITGTQSVIRDLTERKHSQELIWQQANFDELSGLPNRRLFRERLIELVRRCDRDGQSVAVLMIDLDHFKEINDTLGHDAGDQLLVEAAQRIRSCLRESDTVARLGGDEFVVAVADVRVAERVDAVAQNIIDRLSEPFVLGEERGFVSASIGITVYPADAAGIDELLKHADQAMYVAKDQGRNRYSYFTPALQVAAVARMRLSNDLRQALGNGEFRAYFQPIHDVASGRVIKAEALIRWMHPQRGMVSPADFIPLAESSGQIYAIGEWMFQQSVYWAKRWRGLFDPDFQISVNQSPLEFQREGRRHIDWVAMLAEHGLGGEAIILEITEGLLLDASRNVTDKLLALREAGMRVALDDFGTGYSSLAYLSKFAIDFLKIDQSFTRALAPGSSSLAMSEAIIVMAHKLGLRVIAEGVETPEQRHLLEAAGCDSLQGYLLGRPMPAGDFEAMLKAQCELQMAG